MSLRVDVSDARYGSAEAVLGHVAFEVEAGEVLAIVGANGAGKTTLFRALTGRVAVAGTVELDGERLERLGTARRVRRGLGLVPEEKALFPSLTVERHLRLAGSRARGTWDVEQVLELFPSLRRRYRVAAGYLSGGEQQMLAISRALLLDPRALLLDEPSQGLAPAVAQDVFGALEAVRARGAALVVNEQNASLVRSLAHRVIVLRHGEVSADTPASELLSDEDLMTHYL